MKTIFMQVWRVLAGFIRRHPIMSAWMCGIAYEAYHVSWLRTIKLSEVAPDSAVVKLLYVVAVMIMATFLSTAFPMMVLLWRRLKLSWREPRALWIIPTLWIAAEYLQSVLFSIIIYGTWGRIGSFLTFGSPGYFLVKTPFVYLSRLGGLWILSGVCLFFVIGLAQLIWTPRNRLNVGIGLGVLIILTQLSWAFWRTPHGQEQTVALVGLATGMNVRTEDPQINISLGKLPEQSYDAIILPEYSHYFEFRPTVDAEVMSRLARSTDTVVIDSYQDRSARPFINYVTYHRPDGSILDRQHKWFLAPGGEYLPYFLTVPLKLSGNQKIIDAYNFQKEVSGADKPEQPYRIGDVSYGALACAGVISPEIYRGMADRGATLLSNSAALDSIGLSPLYHQQTELMGVLHAVANARPFMQSARGGYIYAYDMDGQSLVRDTSFQTTALTATVQTNDRKTLYTILGDWVAWASIAMVVGSFISLRRS